MFVKRYIVKDMAEAMDKIRKELGSDAVILSNKPVRKKGFFGIFKKKMMEVMVAHETPPKSPAKERAPIEEPARRPQAAVLPNGAGPANQPPGNISFGELISQYAKMTSAVESSADAAGASSGPAGDPKQQANAPAQHAPQKPAGESAGIGKLNENLAELKDVVSVLTQKIAAVGKDPMLSDRPEVMEVYDRLIAQDVQDHLARRICSDVNAIADKIDEEPKKIAQELIAEMLGEPARIKLRKCQQNILMLLGPTGVGKTTTLVKLAGMYAIGQGLKVGLINTDTYRVAAQEQLNTYAEILEIPIITIYTPEEMTDALKALQDRDVILIDTAGKSTGDAQYHADLRAYLEKSGAQEVLLAFSAATGYAACREMIENFSFLEDYSLIITKLDEVSVLGNIMNIMDLAQKPVAFVTTGQNVPQDIEIPHIPAIVQKLLGYDGA
ncbi:MAG: flagellar biosynthesis protein FlhF [Christensenellales bacterium]|jgi:flagellar biosynthesis protein FlhF